MDFISSIAAFIFERATHPVEAQRAEQSRAGENTTRSAPLHLREKFDLTHSEVMALPSLCLTAFTVLRHIEPILVLEQLGSTFFDTGLQMVVMDRCANATYPDTHLSRGDSQQKAMSDFYMIYNLIIRFTPILPSMLLAWLSDRGWRRTPIVVSLSGYLVSRLVLLLVVLFGLPLEVMYGAAVLFGLSGGYCAFWSGVMTLASLGSTATERSKVSVTERWCVQGS